MIRFARPLKNEEEYRRNLKECEGKGERKSRIDMNVRQNASIKFLKNFSTINYTCWKIKGIPGNERSAQPLESS